MKIVGQYFCLGIRRGVSAAKRSLSAACAALAVAWLALSCSMAMDAAAPQDELDYLNSFGVISEVGTGGYFEIARDDGATLRVVEYTGSRRVEEGERVYFKYAILDDGTRLGVSEDALSAPPASHDGNADLGSPADHTSSFVEGNDGTTPWPSAAYGAGAAPAPGRTFDVKVVVFNDLVAPPVIRESFIRQDERQRNDSIGVDLIRAVAAAFSGDYLNVDFEYFRFPTTVEHRVNLVWDDTRRQSDSLFLYLRHNAMNETPTNDTEGVLMSAVGVGSFRIGDLVPEGRESVDVKLTWNLVRNDALGEYTEGEESWSGTFTAPGL